MSSRPIGVFDSGVGGLTVLRELRTALPFESTIYLGDNTRVPYGPLPAETIRQYALECLDYLYRQEAKVLVIACNAASSVALEVARNRYDIPVVGVIDSTATVAATVALRRVGIIGTETTVKRRRYVEGIRAANPELEVFQQACPLLALQVEAGEFATEMTESLLESYLRPLREQQVDTLVLACTHYPFVRPIIEKLMGGQVRIVENGPATVASVVALMAQGRMDPGDGDPVHRMMTTGNAEKFARVAEVLWPEESLEIEVVDVEAGREAVSR